VKILVTGSASALAAAVLPALAADARITHIIGIDRGETAFRHTRFTQVLLDLRSPLLARVLSDVDAVVHLAFAAMNRGAIDRGTMRDMNVGGTQNVVQLAAQQRVARVIILSSAGIYELPARERVISETHPRQALPGFAYAEDKVAIEHWLDGFEPSAPRTTVVRLRPHVIVGPNASRDRRGLMRLPVYVRLTDPPPRVQCVHEDDVARAIVAAIFKDVKGAFNLACADALPLREIQRLRHALALPLPFPLARAVLRLAWRSGVGADPAWVEALRYHLVLDTNRARNRLGWRPAYDSVRKCLGPQVKKDG